MCHLFTKLDSFSSWVHSYITFPSLPCTYIRPHDSTVANGINVDDFQDSPRNMSHAKALIFLPFC